MGVTQPFIHPRPFEVEETLALDMPRLYVMPVPESGPEDDVMLPAKTGRLITMPSRWSIHAKPHARRPYRANTVDWPRGYPAHDDL
jgi:hypothetical protein